jgi:hypothetical protein
MPEFWEFEDLMFGVSVLYFVSVGDLAVVVRRAHVHVAGVFAGSAAVCGYATSPAGAST